MSTSIYLFRNDLRLADNICMAKTHNDPATDHVLHIYCYDPAFFQSELTAVIFDI